MSNPEIHYGDIKKHFETYVQGFYGNDDFIQQNIRLKEDHTLRVVKETLGLSDHLGLDPRRKEFVSIIALLHDIARFPQITLYRSFKDRETRDHGDWGHEILVREGFLKGLPKEEIKRVLTAVRLHNKFILPKDLDDETLLYCHVIRDADKIDIYRVVTSMNVTEEGIVEEPQYTSDDDYNPQLVENLLNSKNADYRRVNSLLDMYLLQLSWLFSLNFPYTKTLISKRGYIEKLLAKLPTGFPMDQVRNHIRAYLGTSPEPSVDSPSESPYFLLHE